MLLSQCLLSLLFSAAATVSSSSSVSLSGVIAISRIRSSCTVSFSPQYLHQYDMEELHYVVSNAIFSLLAASEKKTIQVSNHSEFILEFMLISELASP